jgi:hypothetical protein
MDSTVAAAVVPKAAAVADPVRVQLVVDAALALRVVPVACRGRNNA